MPQVHPVQIHVDMDDVLCDWHGAAVHAHSVPPESVPAPGAGGQRLDEALGMTATAFWRPLDSHEFWANIGVTPLARDLLATAERLAGRDNVVILTRPTLSHWSASGKYAWVAREFPHYARRTYLAVEKWRFARPGYILLDDSADNVDEWVAHGGVGILVPARRNRRHAESPRVVLAELAAALGRTP